ncbi:MAG TPA: GTP 3',8-cyclase MoaA [Nitrospiria bacterium]
MNIMTDAFNRRITYLRVSITDHCNLRCQYCMPAEGIEFMDNSSLLSYDEFLRIIRVAAKRGLKKVRITGGEPLVRRGVVEFVQEISKIEGIQDIALTTNGILLKKMAEPLYKAGLRRLNVSMDSLKAEKFKEITRGDVLERVWEGIHEAERVGFSPIKINCVLQETVNQDEIIDFVKLTLNKPYHVRFIEFMPCANLDMWQRTYKPAMDMQSKIIEEFNELIPAQEESDIAGPAENFKLPGAQGVVGFIHAISGHFCDTCNRVRLSSDGKIRPCLFSNLEVDFREALRNGCTDEEISGLLDQVLGIKPEGHELDKYSAEKMLTDMITIGG